MVIKHLALPRALVAMRQAPSASIAPNKAQARQYFK